MKWDKTMIGATRTVRKFLLLPKCLQGEFRWLEFTRVRQRYVKGEFFNRWKDAAWDVKTK